MATILVVEDAENLVRFIRVNLSVEGHVVLSASSGRQGLDMALEARPDLIILDVMLPQMSGWELLSRLKSHPDLHTIPVLALASAADPQEAARARRLGVADYLVKPVSANELVRRVKRALASGEVPPSKAGEEPA